MKPNYLYCIVLVVFLGILSCDRKEAVPIDPSYFQEDQIYKWNDGRMVYAIYQTPDGEIVAQKQFKGENGIYTIRFSRPVQNVHRTLVFAYSDHLYESDAHVINSDLYYKPKPPVVPNTFYKEYTIKTGLGLDQTLSLTPTMFATSYDSFMWLTVYDPLATKARVMSYDGYGGPSESFVYVVEFPLPFEGTLTPDMMVRKSIVQKRLKNPNRFAIGHHEVQTKNGYLFFEKYEYSYSRPEYIYLSYVPPYEFTFNLGYQEEAGGLTYDHQYYFRKVQGDEIPHIKSTFTSLNADFPKIDVSFENLNDYEQFSVELSSDELAKNMIFGFYLRCNQENNPRTNGLQADLTPTLACLHAWKPGDFWYNVSMSGGNFNNSFEKIGGKKEPCNDTKRFEIK